MVIAFQKDTPDNFCASETFEIITPQSQTLGAELGQQLIDIQSMDLFWFQPRQSAHSDWLEVEYETWRGDEQRGRAERERGEKPGE